jgi:hypothetical protein
MPARKITARAALPRFPTITQVADALSVSTRTVRRWTRKATTRNNQAESR